MARTKKIEEKKQIKTKYFFALGRRKRSVARVKLLPGKGDFLVNGKKIEDYFSGEAAKQIYLKPFTLTETIGKYGLIALIKGGGHSSQLGALIHGISRALIGINPEYRLILKKNLLLRRDPREKERRKFGFAQKARKKKQSPKR